MKKSIIDLLRPLLLLFLAVRMAPLSASSAGVAPQRDTTISREAARCAMRPDTISPSVLSDSVVRRLARELGMVDTAEVAPSSAASTISRRVCSLLSTRHRSAALRPAICVGANGPSGSGCA